MPVKRSVFRRISVLAVSMLAVMLSFYPSYGASHVYIMGIGGSSSCTNGSHGNITLTAGQSGNWTVPAGICQVMVTMWGAGGDGVSSNEYSCGGCGGGGGGGGGVIVYYFLNVTSGNSIPYSVGSHGYNAGSTTFGTLRANGGTGPTWNNWPPYYFSGGAGGSATDGTVTATVGNTVGVSGIGTLYGGGNGGGSYAGGGNSYSSGGSPSYGGGGGGSYGTGGNGYCYGFPPLNGTNGGGGGGGWFDGWPGGNGGNGQINIIW